MSPKDRLAFVIGAGIIAWGVLTIGGAIYRNKSLSEGGTEFFAVIGGALTSMLVSYFTRNNNHK